MVEVSTEQSIRYREKHAGKSDQELQHIRNTLAAQVTQIDMSSARGIALANEMLAEAKVIEGILVGHKQTLINANASKKQWDNSLSQRKEKAVLNLPYATSANGQLIAAILEEEGEKTLQEIANWCDELAFMEEKDVEAILKGLENEEIVAKMPSGKYKLLTVCDEAMIHHNAIELAQEKLGNTWDYKKDKQFYDLLLEMLMTMETSVTQDSLKSDLMNYKKYYLKDAAPIEFPNRLTFESDLFYHLSSNGVLACDDSFNPPVYYLPLLGEKGGKS